MKRVAWGPEIVTRMLPHRRPFLMVDRVEGFRLSPGRLVASRAITINEPVFDGHFPELPLWPGVYTLEALAQATQVLFGLMGAAGAHPDGVDGLVRDLDRQVERIRRGDLGADDAPLSPGFGMLTAVDVKLTHPVFAGDTLKLHVDARSSGAGMHKVGVEATVRRQTAATGTLTVMPRPLPEGFRR